MDDRKKKDKRAIAKNEHKGSKLEYMSKRNRPQKDRRTGEKVAKSAPLDVVELPEDMVAGRNAVMEALKGSRSVNKLMIANGSTEGSIKEIIAVAKERVSIYSIGIAASWTV